MDETGLREDPYEDLIGIVRYLLSHVSVVQDRQSVTWYGAVHGTNFDPEDELSDGAWRVIRSCVEKLVGSSDDRSGEAADDDEPEECPEGGCDGLLHPLRNVLVYI